MSALGRAREADPIQRITIALESLAESNAEIVKLAKADDGPVLEYAPGPPYCPHCGEFNPEIVSHSGGADGQFGEFVLIAQCKVCQGTFFGVPEGWQVFKSPDEATASMKGGTDNGR